MKKLLLIVFLTVVCVGLFAQVTPYGSARVGLWYENSDKDMMGGDKSRLDMNYGLQESSNFGIMWNHNFFESKAELDMTDGKPSLAELWIKRNFGYGCYWISFGLMEDGTNVTANQVWGHDNGLIGYGAVYGGTNPAIRFDYHSGFYAALIVPTVVEPYHTLYKYDLISFEKQQADAYDALIPKINIGWDFMAGKVAIKPTLVAQMFQYNKDRVDPITYNEKTLEFDEQIISYLGAMTVEYADNAFSMTAHFNYGSNIGNMGYWSPRGTNVSNYIHNDGYKTGIAHVASYGGFFQFGFDLTDTFNLNAGAGYTVDSSSSGYKYKLEDGTPIGWNQADDARMAFYLQGAWVAECGLSFIPEFGMINEMKDHFEENEGTKMYFGAQLRYDF